MEAHSSMNISLNHPELQLVRIETIVQHLQSMLDRIDKRFDAFDSKVANNIEEIEKKLDSTIKWMIGIGVTSLISVFGAIINISLKLNG